jgi:DNA modification methylase
MRWEVLADGVTLYLGDCREVLPRLGKVDVVVTDPPYEAEAHTLQRRCSRGWELAVEPLPFAQLTTELRNGVAGWAAANCRGWLLAFCQAEGVNLWADALTRAGATYKRSMVWIKPDGMPQFSGDRPGMGYESIVAGWCGRGKSRWNGGGRHGVFTYNKGFGGGGAAPHPTTKPVALMRDLVALFTEGRAVVVDPFMGSGTTGVAAVQLGRGFIGIERDPKFFDVACERIAAAVKQPDMFVAVPQQRQLELPLFSKERSHVEPVPTPSDAAATVTVGA